MIVFDQLKKNDPHLRTVTWGVLVGLGVLFAGLWWVQVVSHKHYAENQKAQSFRTVRIPAVRGKILDRHSASLAENQPSYNVILYLDELRDQFRAEWARARQPRLVTNSLPFWKRWVGINPVKLEYPRLTRQQRLALERTCRYRVASNAVHQVSLALGQPISLNFADFMHHYTNQLALPLPVCNNLDASGVARLLESRTSPPGIDLEIQPMRYYPSGTLAAHLLGYLQRDNRSMEGEVADFNFRLPDYRGHVGIEGQFDAELRGKAGVKSVLVNSLGYRQTETIWAPAEPGRNVTLTIDAAIQAATEAALQSAFQNTRGAAIVLDPNNGDVLAMASSPAFDPHAFIRGFNHAEWAQMTDEVMKPLLNRVTQGSYAPGSVFKIVTGLSALDHGLNPREKLHNPGHIYVAGRNKKIDDLAKAGDYDFKEAFIHSSNTYFISNGIRFGGIEGLMRIAHRLHLGERTDLMPRQESGGNFPYNATMRRGWVDADTAHICIGQGEVSMTPLQIAILTAAIANGGKVIWPRLVERVESVDPTSGEPPILFPHRPPRDELGVSARSLQLTRDAMFADVEEDGGSGKQARTPGFKVCGKTGTAEVTDSHGKLVDRTTWFASFAPYENPRYVIVLMVEGGVFGGSTCAPAVGKIYQAIQKLEQQRRPTVAATMRSRNDVQGASVSNSRDHTVAATPTALIP
jgi:penicillin-binding protein 2